MKSVTIATASVMLVVASAIAQDPTPTRPGQQPGTQPGQQRPGLEQPGHSRTATENSDQVLATWLLVDNENEVAISRIALQKAQSAEVKQFAQRMIDDHTKLQQTLQSLTGSPMPSGIHDPQTGATGRDPTEADAGRDPKGEYPVSRTTEASGMRGVGDLDHKRLLRDLGRKHRETATKELQSKQGAEFDRCYIGMQVGMHSKTVDCLQVFRNYASPSLRTSIDEALPTVQMHLEQAKELAKKNESTMKTDRPMDAGGR